MLKRWNTEMPKYWNAEMKLWNEETLKSLVEMLKCWYADIIECWQAELLTFWYAEQLTVLKLWNAEGWNRGFNRLLYVFILPTINLFVLILFLYIINRSLALIWSALVLFIYGFAKWSAPRSANTSVICFLKGTVPWIFFLSQ